MAIFTMRTIKLLAFFCLAAMLFASVSTAAEAMSDEDKAAEEAAAAAVEQQAEDAADEDEATAFDEEADTARLDPNKHPLSNMPPSAKDVNIACTFANSAKPTIGTDDKAVLTLGTPLRSLVAFSNAGRMPYHVWGVMGSLNMDNNFNMYVQNFTYQSVNHTVAPGDELSLAYEFTPNDRLDTRLFQLALSVFYEAQSASGNAVRGHSTTFFNQTVNTVPGPQSMNDSTFLLLVVVFIAGVAGGIFYLLSSGGEQKRVATEMGTNENKESEWLEEHSRMMQSGGGRAAPTKANKRR